MNKKQLKALRVLGTIAFILYLICLAYFLFFCENMGRGGDAEYHCNLVFFQEISRFWNNRHDNMWAFVLNIVLNVGAFIPMGFFLPLITHHKTGVLLTTALTFAFSLTIELLQLLNRIGSFDVDDLFMNTLGGCLGAVIYFAVRGVHRVNYRKRHTRHLREQQEI